MKMARYLYRRAVLRRDATRTVRPWRVDLYDGTAGFPRRTRWFRRHAPALAFAARRVGQ